MVFLEHRDTRDTAHTEIQIAVNRLSRAKLQKTTQEKSTPIDHSLNMTGTQLQYPYETNALSP